MFGRGAAALPSVFWKTELQGEGRRAAVGNDPCPPWFGGSLLEHGGFSWGNELVPAVGREVTALRVCPKLKPVASLPSPRPVASTVVTRRGWC